MPVCLLEDPAGPFQGQLCSRGRIREKNGISQDTLCQKWLLMSHLSATRIDLKLTQKMGPESLSERSYLATGKYGCREVRVYPTECGEQLERDPSKKLQIPCFKEFFWGGNTSGLVPSCRPHSLGYAFTLYAPTSEPRLGHFGVSPPESLLSHSCWVTLILCVSCNTREHTPIRRARSCKTLSNCSKKGSGCCVCA